jgi:predicted dehydrogenase
MIRVQEILDSGELGRIINLSAGLALCKGIVANEGDIRLDYGLGGGAMMDLGCKSSHVISSFTTTLMHSCLAYPLSVIRFLARSAPTSVLSATSSVYPSPSSTQQLVDLGTNATLSFPNDVTATLNCDFRQPGWGLFGLIPRMPDIKLTVKCENGEVELYNYVAPVLYHWIRVRVQDPSRKGKVNERVEKVYKFENGSKGEDWWTTYRYQLEAFVDKVKGRTPRTWIGKEDSVENLEWIERIYEKVCLNFVLRSSVYSS